MNINSLYFFLHGFLPVEIEAKWVSTIKIYWKAIHTRIYCKWAPTCLSCFFLSHTGNIVWDEVGKLLWETPEGLARTEENMPHKTKLHYLKRHCIWKMVDVYCKYLYLGISHSTLFRPQLVQNATVRLLTGTKKRDLSPVLGSLHWLPVDFKVIFCL